MKTVEQRHQFILQRLNQDGFVRVQDLSDSLGVTGTTIRKDLRILEEQHALTRNHGSASPVVQRVVDLPVQEKSRIRAAQKARIARAAAALVAPEDSIILTSGSTIEAFAAHLHPQGALNVVTPSLRVGIILNDCENVSTLMLGGHIVRKSLSVRDGYTMDGLRNVRCSKLFFSCDGLDADGGVTTAFIEEARMTRAMMESVSEVVLLTDSSKIGKAGYGKICSLEEIDTLITDSEIPDNFRTRLESLGVRVIIG
ncbi:MAG: DeoR/GlpR transcriptional regulator [Bacteroidales bacterium]|nr:DeoR/GlpR transcriptional regulator [Bacteroidales bacterium]